MKASKMSWQGF